MQKGSKIGFTLWVLCSALGLLAGACAVSEKPPHNGQSHWLQPCGDDSECGDLTCECGVCTIQCTSNDACDAISGISCRSAATLESADQCEDDPGATKLCLSAALAPTPDASAVDAEVADAAVLDAEVPDASSTDAEQDAEVMDASDGAPAPIAPDPDALHVACDVIEADELPPEVELVDVSFAANFAGVFASENVVAWSNLDGTHFRIGDGDIETLADPRGFVALDGTELFLHSDDGVFKHSLASGEPIELASESSAGSAYALALTDNAVYWSATDASDRSTTRIFRSDREPGETIELTEIRAEPNGLAPLGDYVYFLRATSGNSVFSIVRVRNDGSEPFEMLSDPIDQLGNLISDGTSLFATISHHDMEEGVPPPDAEYRVLRVAADGTVSTLFETHKIWWYPGYDTLVADETYLYWVGRSNASTTEQALWRGRKDGAGEPAQIIEGLPDGETFVAVGDASIYVGLHCSPGVPVLRIDKPQ